jgi:hypothetical protein
MFANVPNIQWFDFVENITFDYPGLMIYIKKSV